MPTDTPLCLDAKQHSCNLHARKGARRCPQSACRRVLVVIYMQFARMAAPWRRTPARLAAAWRRRVFWLPSGRKRVPAHAAGMLRACTGIHDVPDTVTISKHACACEYPPCGDRASMLPACIAKRAALRPRTDATINLLATQCMFTTLNPETKAHSLWHNFVLSRLSCILAAPMLAV